MGVHERVVGAELDRLQHHDPFPGGTDLGHRVERPAHDDHPGHAGPDLLGHGAVAVRVVPEQARRMVTGDRDLVAPALAGRDRQEHVVAVAAWRDVQPVRMEVRRRPLVRPDHRHVVIVGQRR
jgi:hypothetical protein